jgi:flagellar biosynthesis protein FliP
LDSGVPGDIPAVIRSSAAFWLASAVAAGILPAVLEVARIDFGQSTPDWAVPYMVAFAVPLTALQVWAAIELLRGAGWARILLTVVAGLSALGAPLDLSGLILAGLALTLTGAALMWTPAANRFFRRGRHGYPVPGLEPDAPRRSAVGP